MSFPNVGSTSLSAAQANQLASDQIMVSMANNNLKSIYLSAFNDWTISVNAGRIPNTNPPQPPTQYIVGPADANGFQWPILDPSGTPVCPVPPIPQDRSQSQAQIQASLPQGVVDIGPSEGGGIFECGPKDTWPAGVPVKGSDGHVYVKFSWVGFGYKYQQIS